MLRSLLERSSLFNLCILVISSGTIPIWGGMTLKLTHEETVASLCGMCQLWHLSYIIMHVCYMIIHSKHMTYEACVNFTVKYRHHYSLIIISIFEIESFKDLWGSNPKNPNPKWGFPSRSEFFAGGPPSSFNVWCTYMIIATAGILPCCHYSPVQ